LSVKVDTSHGSEKQFHKRRSVTNFYDGSLSLLRSCLQHGTLTAELKASGGRVDRSLDAAALRKLAEIGSNPICAVRTWHVGTTPEEQVDAEVLPLLEKLSRKNLIRFVEFDGQPGHAIDLQLLCALAGSNVGTKFRWAGGSAEELSRCLEQFHPTAVYCSDLAAFTQSEATILGNSPALAVLGTGKDIFEGPALMTARRMVEAGVAIALSSGYNSESAASYSMQMALALGVVRLGLTPEEAFSAATINAAYAAGRGDQVGSIEVGKRADLLLLNVPDYREIPSQFGVNHVDMAIRDGNIVLNRTRWRAMRN
jgi:imidazolonepropionase